MTDSVSSRARALRDDRAWASLAHLGGVLGPIPALIVFVVTRQRAGVARKESKEALNWQITAAIGYVSLLVVAGVLSLAMSLVSLGPAASLTLVLPAALYALNVVLSLTASSRVNAGGEYRYPVSVRFLR
ncbi:putative Tic20 family protein [Conyzicola lurida]|uniref:Putative Tic20 family protein n=1 Tax=Conyzicola lurida TaxID=1172621 RepID=A0A841AM55_9MICO|nr:putative Tic20 family protein [Conyzicola lurida]